MPLPSAKFRKPIAAALVLLTVVFLATAAFLALDKFYPCMYQLPYLTLCAANYCCENKCPAAGTESCKPLNQEPFATVTFVAAIVSGSATALLTVLCVCCNCTTKIEIEGEEQADVEVDGEQCFVSNQEAEKEVEMVNLAAAHQLSTLASNAQQHALKQEQTAENEQKQQPQASRFSKYSAKR